MTSKEKEDMINAAQMKLDERKKHVKPAGEEDSIAIDTIAVVDRDHKIEVTRGVEALIGEKEGKIKASNGGYKGIKEEEKEGTR